MAFEITEMEPPPFNINSEKSAKAAVDAMSMWGLGQEPRRKTFATNALARCVELGYDQDPTMAPLMKRLKAWSEWTPR
jgi:hypothetical protein